VFRMRKEESSNVIESWETESSDLPTNN
jgi:hypothetical protein